MRPEPFLVRRGQGVPLIAVHGNGVDHRLLLPLDDVLDSSGGWERIYVDLPGFGQTPALPARGGLRELATWLVTAIGEIVGERPFALLANSLGGLLARHVAARFGEQVVGLALIAPIVDPDPAKRTLPEFTVVERDEAVLATLDVHDRDDFTGIATRQTADSWKAFRDYALPGIRGADSAAMQRLSEQYFLDQVPESLSSPRDTPTVIVTGRQDHVVGYADQFRLLDHYRAATYVVLDAAGHNVHLEQPAAIAESLRGWVRRIDSGPSARRP